MNPALEGGTSVSCEELDLLISCRMGTGSLYDLTRNRRIIQCAKLLSCKNESEISGMGKRKEEARVVGWHTEQRNHLKRLANLCTAIFIFN